MFRSALVATIAAHVFGTKGAPEQKRAKIPNMCRSALVATIAADVFGTNGGPPSKREQKFQICSEARWWQRLQQMSSAPTGGPRAKESKNSKYVEKRAGGNDCSRCLRHQRGAPEQKRA